ncbi:MAG: response regulator [Planctomycetota bacterium]
MNRAVADAGLSRTPGTTPGFEILVVDDNEANLDALEAALAELRRPIIRARSGRDALRLLLDRDFAIVLMDVHMPAMDGLETAQLIRQRGRSRRTPIIFLTAHGQEHASVLRGYELGAVDFLFKPVEPAILRAKTSVLLALQDRTEEVRQQATRLRELERQRWEAQTAREESRRQEAFLSVLAHELRNPLATLAAGVEVLKQPFGGPEGHAELLGAMERQLRQLVRLVDDLMDVSRIAHGKFHLQRDIIDLRDVVRQAIESLQPVLAHHGHRLDVSLPEEALWTDGDALRLVQVVSNLIHNAASYTDPGGHIEVTCVRDGREAALSVTDNGRGIPRELLGRIFDRLVQAESKRGLGLGLTLVRELVQMHGGRVRASSEGPGRGSRFEVHLPLAAAPEQGVVATRDVAETEALRIALLDDDGDARSSMALLLRAWGNDVRAAADGEEGTELIRSWGPDLALVDLDMPRRDGFGVVRALRAEPGHERAWLVALTGYGQAADRARSQAAGFDDHLVKPVSADELKAALRRASQARRPGG